MLTNDQAKEIGALRATLTHFEAAYNEWLMGDGSDLADLGDVFAVLAELVGGRHQGQSWCQCENNPTPAFSAETTPKSP